MTRLDVRGPLADATPAAAVSLLAGVGPVHTDIAVGEATLPRSVAVGATAALTSGYLYLWAFTARKSEAVASVGVMCSTTAAGATPTLCKMGFYEVSGTGALTDDLTLLGVTANDTSLLSVASTVYTRALTTPTAKVAGRRYAIGLLVVSAAAMPTLAGAGALTTLSGDIAPWTSVSLAGQSDMAGNVTATLAGNGRHVFAFTLPT